MGRCLSNESVIGGGGRHILLRCIGSELGTGLCNGVDLLVIILMVCKGELEIHEKSLKQVFRGVSTRQRSKMISPSPFGVLHEAGIGK